MTTEELWQAAIGEIELSVSKASFVTWIKNARLIAKEGGVATLEVPNRFTKEWLENKCNKLILGALRNNSPDIRKLEFRVAEKIAATGQAESFVVEEGEREEEGSGFDAQLDLLKSDVDRKTNLNPKYDFDSFVVGSFNELAFAAAKAVTKIENLGKTYNPLFVYGGVGLGKTHLLQAIGNELQRRYPNQLRIKYTPSEAFTSELIQSIQDQDVDSFKEKYRQIDILIIDDIQFIAGKTKTQIEFFHTFNVLHGANKQIILSSDRPPKAIPTLEERLCSRFEGGMMADIGFPDYESRIAILKNKQKLFDLNLSEDALNFIATKIQRNIRELEGALKKITMYEKTANTHVMTDKIRELLRSLIARPSKRTTPSKIMFVVSEFYEVPLKEIIDGGRKKELVKPRQICMYLLREELQESYPSIGKRLGGRDHTTVIHACNKIERVKQTEEKLDMEINLIRERLYNES